MKKTKLPALLLGALFAGLILSSCDNDFGIMQSIQEEEKQAKNSVFYKATVGGMAKLGSNYYVQMNGIWSRADAAGSSWSSVSGGGLPLSYSCAGLVEAGGSLYAALLGDGVYEYDGTSWTELSDASFTGKNIDAIWAANNLLFLQDHGAGADTSSAVTDDDVYTLYYLNGSALSPTGVAAQTGKAFKGVSYDGTNYWAISGASLFSGAANSMILVTGESNMPSGADYSALYASGTTLYVGLLDGFVYRRASGGVWTNAEVLADAEVSALFEITVPATRLLVGLGGSDGSGYYELPSDLSAKLSGGATGALLSDSTVYSTTLSNKPVNAFFLDGTSLFACTTSGGLAGSGLYRNAFSAGAWGGWASE